MRKTDALLKLLNSSEIAVYPSRNTRYCKIADFFGEPVSMSLYHVVCYLLAIYSPIMYPMSGITFKGIAY